MQNQPLPLIYMSDKRSIYLGRSHVPLREIHAGNSWLMVCLEGHIRFKVQDSEAWTSAKSLLVPAGSKISIDNKNAVVSVCFLDSAKPDFLAIKNLMRSSHCGIYFCHSQEQQLIEELIQLRNDEPSYDAVQARLEELIYSPHGDKASSFRVDPRVQHVIKRLRETSSLNLSVKELAKEVEMSESGLIKLFRKNIGAPIRKHRLWYRLANFVIYVMGGKSIPEATTLAGFSDASHLSKCYSSLMGVPVSVAFSRAVMIKCIVGEEALAKAESVEPKSKRLIIDYDALQQAS